MLDVVQEQLARILGRRQAYRRTFSLGPDGRPMGVDQRIVLADLARFCSANQPTTRISPFSKTVDPIAMAIAEGRREVWLRLQAHLRMNDADIANLKETHEAIT